MKKAKVMLSAFAVLAIAAGALAFKASNAIRFFTSGSVFCTSTCPAGQQVAFKVDPSGLQTHPCPGGAQPYVLIGNSTTADCLATTPSTTFSPTTDQGK